jgi:formylglycine-generating enzyme required for sulfatase activity
MFVVDSTSRVARLAGIVVRGDGTVKSGTTQAIDIGQAVAIVRRSPDPANGGKPHVWPNIVLPDAIDVDAGLRRFVRVPGGSFSMGGTSGDERWPSGSGTGNLRLPVFYMGKFEVTVAQFNECVRAGACLPPAPSGLSTAPDYPVTGVTWYEARKYATWLQQRLASSPETPPDLRRLLDVGWEIDLPSEAEWEKAARRNGKDPYPWGTSPNPSKANYNSGAVKAVGSSRCTDCAFGLEDMAGNVREWTRSLKLNYPYDAAKAEDPAATGPRAVRGGSYQRLFVGAERVRAANREEADPTHLDEYTGFRVAVICREERGCTWQEPD